MTLLTDDQLRAMAGAPDPAVSGLDLNTDYRDAKSQIRAAALDLRVGDIYLPGTDAGEEGCFDKPKPSHTLKSGETAIITPIENFDVPADIVGIVFPSSQVSIHGLLMTNPGYIDPGYVGKLRFTVINMGERPYDLHRGNRIVTLILFRLDQPCAASWRQRKPGTSYLGPTTDDLRTLSRDFLNVAKRAESVVDQKVRIAGLSPGLIVAVTTIFLALASYFVPQLTGITELKTKVAQIESALDLASVKHEMSDHQKRIESLEAGQKKR